MDIYDIFNELKDKQVKHIESVVMPKKHYEDLMQDVREENCPPLTIGFGMKVIRSDLMPDNIIVLKYQDGWIQTIDLETRKRSAIIKSGYELGRAPLDYKFLHIN